MIRFSVQYELDVQPMPVVVEIVCRSKEDQEQVYQDRLGNMNCKRLKKIEKEEK